MAGLALTADQVAAELGYFHRDESPYGELIRSMYREGDFPAPIDPSLGVSRWRWSRVIVEQYAAGEWRLAPRALHLAGQTAVGQ